MDWIHLFQDSDYVEGFCEHDNETSGYFYFILSYLFLVFLWWGETESTWYVGQCLATYKLG
jgi:hypothetical protein